MIMDIQQSWFHQRRIIFWLLLFANNMLFTGSINAQSIVPPNVPHIVSQYALEVWNTTNGLPHNSVLGIQQTSDGYLWFVTFDGLVRFDGVTFTHFNSATVPVMKTKTSEHLFKDRSDALWLSLQGTGVMRVFGGDFSIITKKEGLASERIWAITQDHDGSILIANNTGIGHVRRDSQGHLTFERDPVLNQGIKEYAKILMVDSSGGVWVGTTNELYYRSGGVLRRFTTENGLPDNSIKALFQDRAGKVWVGTGKGCCYWSEDRFICPSALNGLQFPIWAFAQDRQNNYWIATNQGLFLWNGAPDGIHNSVHGSDALCSITTKDGMPDNSVRSVFEDREGNIWAGTYYGGVVKLRKGKFVNITSSEGLLNDVIYSITPSRNGGLWIGGISGVQYFRNGVATNYTTRQGLRSEMVRSVIEDHAGMVWIGSYGGLHTISDGKIRAVYTERDGLLDQQIRVLMETSDSALWIGSTRGLSRFKNGVFKNYAAKEGLSLSSVVGLYEDRQHRLWVATNGGGANVFADGVFTHYGMDEGTATNVIFCFHQDERGDMWLGGTGGLSYIHDGKISVFTVKEGLPDNDIFGLFEDAKGCFWMGTNSGILCVNKQQLRDYASGKRLMIDYKLYNRSDGMKSSSCNTPATGCITRDGQMYFPTLKGVVVIDPEHISRNIIVPSVAVERVVLRQTDSGRFVADTLWRSPLEIRSDLPTRALEFPPGFKNLEITYTALSLTAPENMRFKYKLEGYDEVWTDAGTRRTAFFTNLSPGVYRFRVIACNNDGVWNETGATLELRVLPQWWQTWWFRAIFAIVLVSSLGAGYYARMRYVEAQNRKLKRLAEVRTHELEVTVVEVETSSKEIHRQHEILEEQAREIELTNSQLQEKNQLLENLVAEMNTLNTLTKEVSASLDFNHIMETVITALSASNEFSDFTDISIHLYNQEEGVIKWYGSFGEMFGHYERTEEIEAIWGRLTLGSKNSTVSYIYKTGASLYVPSVEPEKLLPFDKYYQELFGFSSCALFPLHVQGQIIGVVVFYGSVLSHEPLRGEQVGRLGNYATQIAAALHSTQIYQASEQALEHLNVSYNEIIRQQKILEEQATEIEVANTSLQEKNELLEDLNREKNEFLGIAAHDLKNPLAAIQISASLIAQYFERMTKEDIIERSNSIMLLAKRMSAIIMNLLDLNALESGKLNLTSALFNIAKLTQDFVDEYRERAAAKQIEMKFYATAPEMTAFADVSAMTEVLDNLISNAVKYSPPGKTVWVSVLNEQEARGNEQGAGLKPGTCCLILVKDEGPGLNDDDKKQLFGKFARLSAKPTAGEHSTGLGLSIVKKIVEAMHGRVWCESELGQGATFVVELPIAEIYVD